MSLNPTIDDENMLRVLRYMGLKDKIINQITVSLAFAALLVAANAQAAKDCNEAPTPECRQMCTIVNECSTKENNNEVVSCLCARGFGPVGCKCYVDLKVTELSLEECTKKVAEGCKDNSSANIFSRFLFKH
ncbi:uncharacterized protein VTP21DRAFT_369 [Calcarisporiella thermophila]|uniref:uncharacterized protein n=1 Tax=Calcarisporiella thermophila TaxID=911321 RepID=UPI00374265B8